MCFNLLFAVFLHSFFFFFETEDEEEREKVKKAEECCKKILNRVNQAVKEAENKQVEFAVAGIFHFSAEQHFNELCVFLPQQRLQEYQRRLDISSLKQGDHPMILELKARTTCCITPRKNQIIIPVPAHDLMSLRAHSALAQ